MKNMVKEKTCFKSMSIFTCVDLLISNKEKCYKSATTIDTALSDFHKMVLVVLNKKFERAKPKVISYRDYSFRRAFRFELSKISTHSYSYFEEVFLETLNDHAPLKQKSIRANHVPHMTKTLKKAMRHRSQLETKYRKQPTAINSERYRKQNNFCNKLYKKERKKYYSHLDLKQVTDNKTFWQNMKPFLSDKNKATEKITLVSDDKIFSEDLEIAEKFNKFFKNTVDNLNLASNEDLLLSTKHLSDPVQIAVEKYKNHSSILMIQNNVTIDQSFSFQIASTDTIYKPINLLNLKKNGTHGGNPPKYLKLASNESAPIITNIWNEEVVSSSMFPQSLKLADVTPVYKKSDPTLVSNYRPISVLPTMSKVFRRLMHHQVSEYIDKHLSPFLCGHRKGFNTQTTLLSLLEKWKSRLDKKGFAGTVLMELSKAFDTINHELLIAKLNAYGFSEPSLTVIYDYQKDRLQHIKINSTSSEWSELIDGIPQGSVLGPLLFNIYLNDLFYILNDVDICNYVDDTTPNVCDSSLKIGIEKLEKSSQLAIKWFNHNYMRLNAEKCEFLITGHRFEHLWLNVGETQVWEKNQVKLLGITIDNELKFNDHITKICCKAKSKLSALSRLARYLSMEQKKASLHVVYRGSVQILSFNLDVRQSIMSQ